MTEQIVERSELLETPLIPEDFARRYREEGYWIDQTIPEFLLDACRAKPHFPALVAFSHAQSDAEGKPQQIRLSYGELEAAARAAARRLENAGVQPGDRVLLQLGNIAEYLIYLMGIFGQVPYRSFVCHSTARVSLSILQPALMPLRIYFPRKLREQILQRSPTMWHRRCVLMV